MCSNAKSGGWRCGNVQLMKAQLKPPTKGNKCTTTKNVNLTKTILKFVNVCEHIFCNKNVKIFYEYVIVGRQVQIKNIFIF